MDWFTFTASILTGIITGVVANLATHFFTSVCLPAYRDYVYKGTRVDGQWTIIHDEEPCDGDGLDLHWNLSATLKQNAYAITGTAIARFSSGPNGKGDVINYCVSGSICDGLLSLNFSNNDPTRVAHSTFLVKITGDASSLKGYRLFYGLRMDTIRSVGCKWTRGVHGLGECKGQTDGKTDS